MVDSNYKEYIDSAAWQEVRSDKIDSEMGFCEECGCSGANHVHHKHYRTFKRERNEDLQLLCESCHKEKHGLDPWEEFVE